MPDATAPKPKQQRPNRTTFEIPPQLRDRLRRLAESTGRPQSQLLLEALDDYLRRRERVTRQG